jgi:hypothetical protein
MVQGQDPFVKHQRRPGGFGRFLSGIGKLFGAIAMPLSFLFPPAAIGALGMYGLSKIGDQIQMKSQMNAMQKMGQHQASQAIFPGMEDVMGGGPRQAASISPIQADILNVLYARNDLMNESSHAMES